MHLTVAAALAVLLLGTASAARGFFVGDGGSGTGGAVVAPLTGVALSAAATAGPLRPGGTAALTLTASNANPRPVRIAAIRLDAVSVSVPGCVNPAITMAPQTNGGNGWAIPAHADGPLAITIPGAVAMGAGADSACQGATFVLQVQAVE